MPGLPIRRMAGHLGAEVHGIDLAAPLDTATVADLRNALLKHKVIFFRDQHLGHAEQVAFGRWFGPLTPAHPYETDAPAGFPEVLTVDWRHNERRYGLSEAERHRDEPTFRSGWHTDLTPVVNPPAACILRAETVPPFGGDTIWSSLVAAYAGLSAPLRAFVDGLHAEHSYLGGEAFSDDERDGYQQLLKANRRASVHPVVRVHPETGERALFVNPQFTRRIVELSGAESSTVLDLLFEQIARPTYTVRFRWEPGSVAFWDNRATAHLIPTDLDHFRVERRMHRVAIIGEVPVGPDGRRSTTICGAPFPPDALDLPLTDRRSSRGGSGS